jgi:hypothetical protein
MLKTLLFSFLFLYCSTIKEKENWKESAVFLKTQPRYPIVEIYASPSEMGISPPVKLKFLIDTGSNISFIRKDFLPNNSKAEKYTSYTIAGKTEITIQKIDLKLESLINEKLTQSHTFHMMKFSSNFPFDGILGNDFLFRYTSILDFPNGIYIFPNEPNLANLAFQSISLEESIQTHFIVRVQFQNKNLHFLLDTGAEISFLDEDEISNLNLKPYQSKKFISLSGDLLESNTFLIPKLCIQENLCEENIEFLTNKSLRQFLGNDKIVLSGLFGMNWIKNYYLLIKYPNRKLFLLKKS